MLPVSTSTSDNTNNWLSPLGQLPPAFPNGYVEEIDLPSPESRSMQIFQTGLIITNDVDTLARLLKNITRDVMNKFTYRVNLYACDSVFSNNHIKSFITRFVYLPNIPFEEKKKSLLSTQVKSISMLMQNIIMILLMYWRKTINLPMSIKKISK